MEFCWIRGFLMLKTEQLWQNIEKMVKTTFGGHGPPSAVMPMEMMMMMKESTRCNIVNLIVCTIRIIPKPIRYLWFFYWNCKIDTSIFMHLLSLYVKILNHQRWSTLFQLLSCLAKVVTWDSSFVNPKRWKSKCCKFRL